MRKVGLVCIVFVIGCAATQEGNTKPDAEPVAAVPDAPPPPPPDAAAPVVVPDGRPDAALPDGRPDAPEAFDALVPPPIDAYPPDAMPTFDAPPPDACFGIGTPCTKGLGVCARQGTIVCTPSGAVCDTPPLGTPHEERCNGLDDDCDGVVDNGFDVGADCVSGIGECARPGKKICNSQGNKTICDAEQGTPTQEVCDGKDNDCNGAIDNGFDVNQPCVIGMGACMSAGVKVCDTLNTTMCNAPIIPSSPEICDGIDNDCDGVIDNGFDVNQPCTVGVGACAAPGVYACLPDHSDHYCNGTPGTPTPDICDGIDNDCNPLTPDGYGDLRLIFQLPCGAGPNDQCPTGKYNGCVNGQITCSDTVVNDTSQDPNNCGSCGTVCTNAHGGRACSGGVCTPTCSYGWQDCDNNPNNGCETTRLNSASVCNGAMEHDVIDLGVVAGDDTGSSTTRSDHTEGWYHVKVAETSDGLNDLNVKVTFTNPPGVRFGVCGTCYFCGSGVMKCMNPPPAAGDTGTIYFGSDDDPLSDDSFGLELQVYYISGNGTSCGDWNMSIAGTEDVSDRTCDP
jgi:hypothetical protein